MTTKLTKQERKNLAWKEYRKIANPVFNEYWKHCKKIDAEDEVLAEVEKIIEKCFDDINLSYDDCVITYEFKERLKQKIQALSEKDKSEGEKGLHKRHII